MRRYLNCQECRRSLEKHKLKYCSDKCRRSKYYKTEAQKLSIRDRYLMNRLNGMRNRSTRKGLKFDLSKIQLDYLLSQPCVYCGEVAGTVDRKDSYIGYIYSNCVSACKRCNTIKSNYLSYEEMLQVADLLYKKVVKA